MEPYRYQNKQFFSDGIEEVKLLQVYDGDTASFLLGSKRSILCRFLGINTPECTKKVEPFGKEALNFVKERVVETADRMIAEAGVEMRYMVGTMIEIPRACLTADEIAKEAEFFSFGTNDLTQMTLGFSRDDTGKLLEYYVDKGIYEDDPFKTLDVNGVGKLIEMSVKLGKQARPNIKLGICGEHGGDPKTIEFCHKAGLTYVSCSPFRVPIARLAAAQAAIKNK